MPGSSSTGVATGFDSAPASQRVPHDHVLRPDSRFNRPAPMTADSMRSHGKYRLKYILEPKISVHPRSFSCSVPQDGPYKISNMWSERTFHHSML